MHVIVALVACAEVGRHVTVYGRRRVGRRVTVAVTVAVRGIGGFGRVRL